MTTDSKPWLPTISVVVPVLNEAPYIAACLRSVQAQDYPAERVDIIVADGGSSDQTREIVARIASDDKRIRLIDNPRRNQAAGLNEAIASSHGELVARLDGHADWYPHYLSRCVEILEETGADNVGGPVEAVAETPTGQAIARAFSSVFGAGGARHRYGKEQMLTDTVFPGCFRRSALERVGPYNETFPPHEDYELNYRIRTTGGSIVFSPDVPTRYWSRTGWAALVKQNFRYGRAKARVARHSPGVVRPYHLVPAAAVGVAVVGMLTPPTRRALVPLALIYAAGCVVASIPAGRDAAIGVRLRIPLVFAGMHAGWGSGFWAGMFEYLRPAPSLAAEASGAAQVAAR